MFTRMTIILKADEREALLAMAERDLRYPREQLRYLLREEACRRGLLSNEQPAKHEEEQDGETAVTRP